MRILITAPYNDKGRKDLEDTLGVVIYRPWKKHGRAYTASELLDLLKQHEAEALITEHDEVSDEVIRAFPNLAFIGVCRGTPSNVALDTAQELGIPVFNTPARNAQAVAEMFIANVISLLRHTLPGIQWLQEEQWSTGAHASYLQFKGNELAGKTIGMVGFGAVGQTIARLLESFPCSILYYDPFYSSSNPIHKKASLETLFSEADIVSVNLPVTPETKGMIDTELIDLMKSDAIFVNTARAVVVNREALLAALEGKRIRGAVLDVFDHEPPDELDYKLIHMANVLATPHIAGATFEVEDHHVEILNRQLLAWKDQVSTKVSN